ncbi:hypothetical protein NDU88_004870 [Pleurodeles waltl]|uniref:Uncharacterized protein n=1 Tax=Pleurodeles waltl TaxID=8319 RepID=A0AAV7V693_PLEWA|nr:hypothetical protein NDU88_004870 [Pleurodeles waltl]
MQLAPFLGKSSGQPVTSPHLIDRKFAIYYAYLYAEQLMPLAKKGDPIIETVIVHKLTDMDRRDLEEALIAKEILKAIQMLTTRSTPGLSWLPIGRSLEIWGAPTRFAGSHDFGDTEAAEAAGCA